MSRRLVFALPFAFVALAPASSLAADDCPDGWFCEDNKAAAPQPSAAPAERPQTLSPSEPPGPPPSAPPGYNPPGYPPPGYYAQPPRPPEESDMNLEVPDNPPARKRHRRPFREWGFNLHVETALLGDKHERANDAGMSGLGFGLRYRPLPPLAFEAGVDLLTGTDFNGYSRSEAGLLLNTLVFFNPHDIVQVYGLGGLGFSTATVTIDHEDQHYGYFGGQLGAGVEVRVTRNVALAADLIGFIRGRIDTRDRDRDPEFVDPDTHRATNTSGGGLLRAGATFYW